jgi:hypothetical protein
MRKRTLLCGAAVLGLATTSRAAIIQTLSPYTDTQGDQVGSSNAARDIWSATINNDATNLYFTINLNPAANLATSTFKFGIGITTGPGANGDLSTDSTWHGNAYKYDFSIASSEGGMTDFIGLFPAGPAGANGSVSNPWTSYGFNDFIWNNTTKTWGSAIETVSSGVPTVAQGSQTGLSSITLTVPMSDLSNLNLQTGSSFLFDIYDIGASASTAYDSLADSSPTQSGTFSNTAQYDGTAVDSYTIAAAVPEPTSLGLLSCGGLLLLKRRAKA